MEAQCLRCGDIFNPTDDDLLDEGGCYARHYNRTSDDEHQGEECGGVGEVLGEWIYTGPLPGEIVRAESDPEPDDG